LKFMKYKLIVMAINMLKYILKTSLNMELLFTIMFIHQL
jgi:hypothetical protein